MAKNKNKTPWYITGLHFECQQCGNCCSGPGEGYIWATPPEIKLIAEYLKIPQGQLRQKYLKRIGLRTTIIEQPMTKDCVFLNHGLQGSQKKVYDLSCSAKPVQDVAVLVRQLI